MQIRPIVWYRLKYCIKAEYRNTLWPSNSTLYKYAEIKTLYACSSPFTKVYTLKCLHHSYLWKPKVAHCPNAHQLKNMNIPHHIHTMGYHTAITMKNHNTQNSGYISQSICWVKEARHKRVHISESDIGRSQTRLFPQTTAIDATICSYKNLKTGWLTTTNWASKKRTTSKWVEEIGTQSHHKSLLTLWPIIRKSLKPRTYIWGMKNLSPTSGTLVFKTWIWEISPPKHLPLKTNGAHVLRSTRLEQSEKWLRGSWSCPDLRRLTCLYSSIVLGAGI